MKEEDEFYVDLEHDKYYFNGIIYVSGFLMIVCFCLVIYEISKGQACNNNNIIGDLILAAFCSTTCIVSETKVYFLNKLIAMKNLNEKQD